MLCWKSLARSFYRTWLKDNRASDQICPDFLLKLKWEVLQHLCHLTGNQTYWMRNDEQIVATEPQQKIHILLIKNSVNTNFRWKESSVWRNSSNAHFTIKSELIEPVAFSWRKMSLFLLNNMRYNCALLKLGPISISKSVSESFSADTSSRDWKHSVKIRHCNGIPIKVLSLSFRAYVTRSTKEFANFWINFSSLTVDVFRQYFRPNYQIEPKYQGNLLVCQWHWL